MKRRRSCLMMPSWSSLTVVSLDMKESKKFTLACHFYGTTMVQWRARSSPHPMGPKTRKSQSKTQAYICCSEKKSARLDMYVTESRIVIWPPGRAEGSACGGGHRYLGRSHCPQGPVAGHRKWFSMLEASVSEMGCDQLLRYPWERPMVIVILELTSCCS